MLRRTQVDGRALHIGARTDLDVVTGELMEIVGVLDGLNRYRFGTDPEAMAGWIAAKPSTGDVASAA